MACEAEATFILAGFNENLRSDGRVREQYRQIDVATNFLAQCNGSSRVQIGATDVVAGVKVELGSPEQHEDCGRVEVTVASSAVADAHNQGRGSMVKDSAMEAALQDMVQGPPGAKGVGMDLRQLLITKDNKCWNIFVDCIVLNDDGNALDALALAVKAAISRTGVPRVEVSRDIADGSGEGALQVDTEDTVPLQAATMPVIVTVHKVGGSRAVDCTAAEAAAATNAGLQVAVDGSGNVCGVTKVGSQGMDPSVLLELMQAAQHLGPCLAGSLDAQLQRETELEAEGSGDMQDV